MIDRSNRMYKIRKRVYQHRIRHEKQLMGILSVICLVMTGGIGGLLATLHNPGRFTIYAEYGSVLLHNSGEPYIVIGVFAFIGGAAFTIMCIKLKHRKKIMVDSITDEEG